LPSGRIIQSVSDKNGSEALFYALEHRIGREVEKTMYVITFRSVTYAQRAEQLMTRQGYRCHLQRTPAWMEQQGCGYSLRLYAGSVHRAVELLKDQRIPLRRVYVQTASGDLEELEL
jgi:hypothetical protein